LAFVLSGCLFKKKIWERKINFIFSYISCKQKFCVQAFFCLWNMKTHLDSQIAYETRFLRVMVLLKHSLSNFNFSTLTPNFKRKCRNLI
jgi:hypothetical protein